MFRGNPCPWTSQHARLATCIGAVLLTACQPAKDTCSDTDGCDSDDGSDEGANEHENTDSTSSTGTTGTSDSTTADDTPTSTGDDDKSDTGETDTGDTNTGDTGNDVEPPTPEYDAIESYTLMLDQTADPTDVYHPRQQDIDTLLPLVVLLQGANVDKQHYEHVARGVASFGFVVAVPNHNALLPPGLFTEQAVILDALATLANDATSDVASPIYEIMDVDKLGLMGHSYGGVAGMNAIQGACTFPFCSTGTFARPQQLKAAAFYGTNVGVGVANVDNDGIAVMLVQGALDGASSLADGEATYEAVENPPKAFVTVLGANHYGIANINNPSGAQADLMPPTIDQATANDVIARYSAYWLLAYLSADADALAYLAAGVFADPHATVVIEQ